MLLIFDFDGTLMDTLRDLAEAASDLSEAYGGRRLTEDEAAAMIGEGAPVFVARILARTGIVQAPAEALPQYLAFYERRVFDHTAPYPGAVDMLATLAPRHRLALLTNKPEASTRALLRHTGLDSRFDAALFGDGALPRKPDPAGILWLMSRFQAKPEDTLMVGDSTMDLDAARAAGVRACLARYGFGFPRIPRDDIRPDDLVIDHAMELVRALNDRG